MTQAKGLITLRQSELMKIPCLGHGGPSQRRASGTDPQMKDRGSEA